MSGTAQYLSDDAQQCIERIEKELFSNGVSRWVIEGEASAGKSSVLRQLRSRLAGQQRQVIYLAPPQRALDAGPCVLLSLAGQLREAQDSREPEFQEFLKPQPLEQRFAILQGWLTNCSDELVILSDEPETWPFAGEHSTDLEFAEQTQQVLQFLAGIQCRHVLTGKTPKSFPWARDSRVRLSLKGHNEQFLRDAEAWGELLEHAELLLRRSDVAQEWNSFSPLEIRLMVGLQAEAPHALDDLSSPIHVGDLFASFRAEILANPKHSALKEAWQYLSLCRVPITTELLDAVEDQTNLPHFGRQLLRSCLLYRENDLWVLHWTLRGDVPEARELQLHDWLAHFYGDASRAASSVSQLLELEAEAFHHAVESDNPQIENQFRCLFVEQLNLWGRRLSRVGHNYVSAVHVFDRALQWDPSNAYANHYLAFNLDMQARDPERIEAHYRKAVSLSPNHPWCHSRLICFLLALSRTDDAHAAWAQARVAASSVAPQQLYRELHFWVVRMLLHRGQLDFARELLETIPRDVYTQVPELQVLADQQEAQLLAQTHGALVPSPVLKEGWWTDGPFRLPPRLKTGHQLKRWCAGRVEQFNGRTVEFRLALIEVGSKQRPTVHHATIDEDTLDNWFLPVQDLEVGAFVEIGTYENIQGGTQERCMLHQPDAHPLLRLPPVRPDPDRYTPRALP